MCRDLDLLKVNWVQKFKKTETVQLVRSFSYNKEFCKEKEGGRERVREGESERGVRGKRRE